MTFIWQKVAIYDVLILKKNKQRNNNTFYVRGKSFIKE